MGYVTITTTSMETNKLPKAIKYAEKKHGKQKYGRLPYMFHLNMVAMILTDARFFEDEVMCTAYLHDVLEDTKTTVDELRKEFGDNIAHNVLLLTDSKLNNHESLKGISAIVKVADRIANQNACIYDKNLSLGFKYIKDYKHISKLVVGEALTYELNKGYKILYKMLRDAVISELGITRQSFSEWVSGKSSPRYSSIEGLRKAGIDICKYV